MSNIKIGIKKLIVIGIVMIMVGMGFASVSFNVTAVTTYKVDDDWQVGSPPYAEDTDGDNDFATIQAAVNAAAAGDKIDVEPGTYTSFNLNKKLDVEGSGVIASQIAGTVVISANEASLKFFTIRDSASHGVHVVADRVFVDSNVIRNNGGSGVRMFLARECRIWRNEINNNRVCGISMASNSNSNSIDENVIHHNTQNGVEVDNSHRNTFVMNFQINDNGYNGISLRNANRNTMRDNTISANGNSGPGIAQQNGIFLHNSDNSAIRGNTVTNNNFIGIWVTHESSSTDIMNNKIHNNGDDGINLEHNIAVDGGTRGDDNNLFPDGTNIRNNEVRHNSHEGIHIYSGSNTQISNNRVNDNVLDGIVFEPDCGNGNEVKNNDVHGNGNTGGAGFRNGIVMWSDNPVTVEGNNIHDQNEDGILIYKHPAAGVLIPHKIIRNEIKNCDNDGIEIEPWGGAGTSVHGVIIEQNDIHDCKQNGIKLEEADRTQVTKKNKIHDNTWNGIRIIKSKNVEIFDNNILNKNKGHGIEIMDSSMDIVIKNKNNIFENDLYGIRVTDSSRIKIIEKNHIHDNKQNGILFIDSNNNEVQQNKILKNMWNGVVLIRANTNKISNNDINDHPLDGISLRESDSNEISMNNLNRNILDGIYLERSKQNKIMQNRLSEHNEIGINLSDSDQNLITGNYVYKGTKHGVMYTDSDTNDAYCNTIIKNSMDGFHLDRSNTNLVHDNEILLNVGDGFELVNSRTNRLFENNVVNNGNWVQDTNPAVNDYSFNYWVVGAGVLYFDTDFDFIGDIGVVPFPSALYDPSPYVIPIAHAVPPVIDITIVPYPPYTPITPTPTPTPAPTPVPPFEPISFGSMITVLYKHKTTELNPENYEYIWDMGDGNMYYGGSEVVHTYAQEGFYTVTCYVMDRYQREYMGQLDLWVVVSEDPGTGDDGNGNNGNSHDKDKDHGPPCDG